MTGNSADDSSDVVQANEAAARLLLPSFVADYGHFGGNPTLRFANNNLGAEVWLSIDAPFDLNPSPLLPEGLTDRQRAVMTLDGLLGREVQDVTCSVDGSLRLCFRDGSIMMIRAQGSESGEPWELREANGKALIVACGPSRYAIWASAENKSEQ